MEFCATVAPPNEAKQKLKDFIEKSKDIPKIDYSKDTNNIRKIGIDFHSFTLQANKHTKLGDQADALVDSYYYSLNAAAKAGINLSALFEIGAVFLLVSA